MSQFDSVHEPVALKREEKRRVNQMEVLLSTTTSLVPFPLRQTSWHQLPFFCYRSKVEALKRLKLKYKKNYKLLTHSSMCFVPESALKDQESKEKLNQYYSFFFFFFLRRSVT